MTRRLFLITLTVLALMLTVAAATPAFAANGTAKTAATPSLHVQPNDIHITGLGDSSALQIAIFLTLLV